jgi:intracellular sulfur oxidation DsrE/DsrF family protein
MRILNGIVAAILMTVIAAHSAGAATHKLALQVSDNNAEKMGATLSVAANVSRFYAEQGDSVEIVVVAFNDGLHMLREDTSPVKARLQGFADGMPDVHFVACGMTLQSMAQKEGRQIPVMKMAEIAPAGVVRLLDLAEQGYTLVRP